MANEVDIPDDVLILDAGHGFIKARSGGKETKFTHAIYPLRDDQFDEIVAKAGEALPKDYLRINGKPYAVSDTAFHHGVIQRRKGADRYDPHYYGVFLATALFRLNKRGGEVALFAAHPTGDVRYREELRDAAYGDWRVMHGDECREYRIQYINTFEELVGAAFNRILDDDGRKIANKGLIQGRLFGLDIGDGTTDLQSLTNGVVSYDLSESLDIGTSQVEADFEKALIAANSTFFKHNRHIDTTMLREALKTNVYRGGGKEIPCELQARAAKSKLLNRISDIYYTQGKGPANWHAVLLAGGGCARYYDELLPILDHGNIFTAEEDLNKIQFAAVRGGEKLWEMWKRKGWLK